MKKYWMLIIALLNAAVTAVYIACSPYDTVPTHWNFEGAADAFMTKWSTMMFPGFLTILAVVFLVSKNALEKRNEKNGKYADKIFGGMFIFFTGISWLCVSMSINRVYKLGGIFNTALLMLFGALITFFSNLMPKLGQNRLIGVRTKSTLSSEIVWRKTHKLAGYLGVFCGIALMVLAVCNAAWAIESPLLIVAAIVPTILLVCVLPAIYAVVIYRKENSKD